MEILNLLNKNQGPLEFIGIVIALIGIFYGYKKISNFTIRKNSKNNYIKSQHYEAGRDIKITDKNLLNPLHRPKLGFTVENPQASNKPVVLENPDRGSQHNKLCLYVHNSNDHSYAENIKVKVKWPPKGFSTIGLYDRTGNHREKWESAGGEKIYDHGESVSGGEKLMVGEMIVTKFDGTDGEIEYTVYAKSASSLTGKVIITKQLDQSHVGL